MSRNGKMHFHRHHHHSVETLLVTLNNHATELLRLECYSSAIDAFNGALDAVNAISNDSAACSTAYPILTYHLGMVSQRLAHPSVSRRKTTPKDDYREPIKSPTLSFTHKQSIFGNGVCPIDDIVPLVMNDLPSSASRFVIRLDRNELPEVSDCCIREVIVPVLCLNIAMACRYMANHQRQQHRSDPHETRRRRSHQKRKGRTTETRSSASLSGHLLSCAWSVLQMATSILEKYAGVNDTASTDQRRTALLLLVVLEHNCIQLCNEACGVAELSSTDIAERKDEHYHYFCVYRHDCFSLDDQHDYTIYGNRCVHGDAAQPALQSPNPSATAAAQA